MPEIVAEDRIAQLKKARDAAQAIIDEIKKRNISDPFPPRKELRKVKLLEAVGDVRDLDNIIDDEQAATLVVSVDPDDVADLQTLAGKLDDAITGSILQTKGLTTITTVLGAISSVRDKLDA